MTGRSASRNRSVRARRQTGRILRQPCRYYLKGVCTRSPCEYWHPPECQFFKTESGCKAGDKCLFPRYKVEEQPCKKLKKSFQNRKSDDKGAVAIVTSVPLELYDLEIHQKKIGTDYHRLKTMVKRSIEQDIRNENFGSRNGNYEKNAVVKNQGTKQRVQRILGDCWQWETNGQCVKGDNCSFLHDMNKRGRSSPSNPSPNSFMRQSERKPSRTRSPRGISPSARMSRWLCKDYLRGTCNNSFCEKWHPPECLFHKTKSGCRFGEKCSCAHRQVDEQPTKRSTKNDDKSAVAMLKKGDWHESGPVTDQSHDRSGQPDKRSDKKLGRRSSQRRSSDARQLGCVFQDMTPPKSILRKSTDMPKPTQRVKFTKAVARHTKNRDQNPSLGYICPGEPHERSPNAPKFEDRSQDETEWQEQGAPEAAWKLAKSVFKLKEHERATFFSPSENRCLPASSLKPVEREFVAGSGASMHMISKKDLSHAEMDTLTKSCSPTIITANEKASTPNTKAVAPKKNCTTGLYLARLRAIRTSEKREVSG